MFLDAELMRIQEQVELIREQAALSTDPELLSQRIDQIAATLGGTAQWIRDQQQVYGAMEDLLAEPPPLRRTDPRQGEPVTVAAPRYAARVGHRSCAICSARARRRSSCCTATSSISCRPSGRLLSLKGFLDEVMFAGYDVVLHYDRSRGVRATRGAEDWGDWLEQALGADESGGRRCRSSASRDRRWSSIDRYLLRTLNLRRSAEARAVSARGRSRSSSTSPSSSCRAAMPLQLGGPFSANVVKALGWANDPAILQSNIVTVFITEGLHDLNELVVENPHTVVDSPAAAGRSPRCSSTSRRSRRRSFRTCEAVARCRSRCWRRG